MRSGVAKAFCLREGGDRIYRIFIVKSPNGCDLFFLIFYYVFIPYYNLV